LMSFLLVEVQSEWELSRTSTATIGAVAFCGMLLGGWIWGILADMYGRRITIIAQTTLTFTIGIISASATGPISLSLLRALVGFGIGGAPVSFALFAEYLPTDHRGMALVLVQGLSWTIGSMLQALLAWIVIPTMGWRWLLVVSAVPIGALTILFILYLPESARWYLIAGKTAEAQYFIREVGIMNRKPIGGEYKLADVKAEPRGQMAALLDKSTQRSTLMLWGVWFCNQFVYYGIIVFSSYYFRTQDTNVYLVAFITATSEIPGLLLALFLIDRKGRRLTMAILLIATGANVLYLSGAGVVTPSLLALFAFFARGLVSGSFAAAYVYTPELYPTSCRTTGVGAANAVGRIAAIFTIYVALIFQPETYIVPILLYALVACIGALYALKLPVETMNMPLQDCREDSEEEDEECRGLLAADEDDSDGGMTDSGSNVEQARF